MSDTSLWFVLAGVLLIAELTTGTFYLLMVSIGAALGGLAAWLGAPLELQIAAAAAFSVVACFGVQKSRKGSGSPAQDLQNNKLDIGNPVKVEAWDADSRTQVQYRGAVWTAESVDETPQPGTHLIVDVEGNLLKVKAK